MTSLTWRLLVLLVWLASAGPSAGTATVRVAAQPTGPQVVGVELATTTVAGWPVHYDLEIAESALAEASVGLQTSLSAVPRVTGLPPFRTPIVVYLLADQARFRAALQEIGGVRIELVALEVGGYTIERDGSMLIFFPYQAVADRVSATLGFAHELAHLSVREASARRPVPQWLNEGFAQWASYRVLAEVDPIEVDELFGIDRAVVASAVHSRVGLLPWPSLVTRTRFSRSGVEGWANLAYGQGTLFIDWLGGRHGFEKLAAFLGGIGEGAGTTAAFQSAFGPFGPEEAAFHASLDDLTLSLVPGLRRLTAVPRPGRPVLYAVIGGRGGEPIVVETLVDGELLRRRESTLDPAGFGVVGFSAEMVLRPGVKLVRVSSPSLGVLEAALKGDGTFDDAPRRSAPAQVPRNTRRLLQPAA